MNWSDEERRRNLEATQRQLAEDVDAFLQQERSVAAGFDENDLAGFVRSNRIDKRAAHQLLMGLKSDGRVHYLAGRWHVGPLPDES